MVEKKPVGRSDFIFFIFCFCVTVGETSVCFICLSVSEIHRHIIYQKKADFLSNLVTGVWNNWPSEKSLKKKKIHPTLQEKKSQSGGLQETLFYSRVALSS